MAGPIRQVADTMGEAVVKPVSDEVGKAIEEGVQSITGKYPTVQNQQNPTLNPQVQMQKQQSDANKKQNVMRFLNQYNKDYQLFQQQKIQEQQKKQEEIQKEQEEKMK